jgi:HK97 family phage portal protein
MNYFEKIVSAISPVVQRSGSWDSVFLKNLETKMFGDQVENKPYKISQLVYVCISTTGRAISQVPLQVMVPSNQPKKKSVKALDMKSFMRLKAASWRSGIESERMIDKAVKDGELEPVDPNNAWQMLLDNPNPYMDGSIFKYALVGYVLLDGNVWTVPFPPDAKQPLQIWVTNKEAMEPVLDKVTGQLSSWRYRPRGLQFSVNLKPEEVGHMKLWNPYDQIMGQAPLEAGKIEIRTDYKASVYNETFFDEGAVPEGIVYTEKVLKPEKKQRTQNEIENRHKGYRKSHRLMVLDKALKYQQIGITQKDMAFADTRAYSRETVFQTFGMKKAVVAVTDDLNYATAQSQEKGWWNNTCLPLMRMISTNFNYGLFRNLPYIVRWDKSSIEALQEDFDKKVETGKKLFFMGYSRNAINAQLELGFDEDDAGNISYLNQGLKAVAIGGVPIPEPEPVAIPEPIQPTEEPKKIMAVKPKLIEAPTNKAWEDKARQVQEQLWADSEKIETSFASKVKRALFEMRKSVIGMANGRPYGVEKGISKGKPSPQQLLHDIDGVNFQTEKDLLDKLTSDLYVQSAELGAASVGAELGVNIAFDVVDPIVLQYVAVRRLKVKGALDTVKKQLRSQIHDGMQEGESIDQIADRIKGVFNVGEKRATTIARTEVIGTTNFGRFAQMQHTGFTRKIWFTAKDERVRHSHQLMFGNVVGIGDNWIFDDGTTVRYPGDYMGAARQVINCRCVEVVDPKSFDPSRLGPVSQSDVNNLGKREE